MGLAERRGERAVAGVQVRCEEFQHVVGRRAQGPGAREHRQVPGRDGRAAGVMSGGEASAHRGRQGDRRVLHAEGLEDPLRDELLVAHAGFSGEDVPEQPDSEVRVFVLFADVARQRVVGEEVVQLFDRVIGIGIFWIFRGEVAGQARKAGGLRREIQQRDLLAVSRGEARGGRKVFRGRIFELHLSPPDHVGQQRDGEDLGDRADLENAVPVERPVRRAGVPVGDDAAAALVQDPDDDPGAPPGLDALLEDCQDFGVRREALRRGCPRREQAQEERG